MKPASPVVPGAQLPEATYAEDQPQYQPLPVFKYRDEEGTVLSRWHCTWKERLRVFLTGDVYLYQMTFDQPLQPVMLETKAEVPGQKKKRLASRIWHQLENRFGGHFDFKLLGVRILIYGFNAMHVAVNLKLRQLPYLCFHPPMFCFGRWWPWYFYISRNATPWAATFAIGPGVSREDKERASLRRKGLIPIEE